MVDENQPEDIRILHECFPDLNLKLHRDFGLDIYNRIILLDLFNQNLGNLPSGISRLESLVSLDLRHVKISHLPETFGQLENLTYLTLNSNVLTTIPDSFANLHKLTRLFLNNYTLQSLPDSMYNLDTVEYIIPESELLELVALLKELRPDLKVIF